MRNPRTTRVERMVGKLGAALRQLQNAAVAKKFHVPRVVEVIEEPDGDVGKNANIAVRVENCNEELYFRVQNFRLCRRQRKRMRHQNVRKAGMKICNIVVPLAEDLLILLRRAAEYVKARVGHLANSADLIEFSRHHMSHYALMSTPHIQHRSTA